jgi:putative glycosyltransferase (TIGR04372 family)
MLGITALAKKVSHRRAFIASGILVVPVVLLIRIIRPLVLVTFCGIPSGRIGQFTIEAVEQINNYQNRKRNEIRLFYFFNYNRTCNEQWARMLKRTLPVYSRLAQYIDRWNKVIPGGSAHHIESTATEARYLKYYVNQRDVSIDFLPDEAEIAKNWLRAQGWKDGELFVCLLVRDSAFLANDPLNAFSDDNEKLWSYHDYRNSNIDTYVPAVQWLLDQNIWVLRMGALMKTPMPLQHERFIDYAFSPTRSDLLDIWLFSNNKGIISTATGLDQLACIYHVPLLMVNAMPLGCLYSFSEVIWVPKNLRHMDTRKSLTLAETLDNEHYYSQDYVNAGLEIIDLNEQEILLAVQEFWQRITGTWVQIQEDLELQTQFWSEFQSWPGYSKSHDWKHPKARVGQAWLASMGENFLKNN